MIGNKMRRRIVRLCVSAAAALPLLGMAGQARADCEYIYRGGSGIPFLCGGGGGGTWAPCLFDCVSFNAGAWQDCFNACLGTACSKPDPQSAMNSCMLNNGSPWSCGTCG